MAINRGPWNALVDDDGSNLVGSVWNKAAIKDVILDPADAALAAVPPPVQLVKFCIGPHVSPPGFVTTPTHNYRPPNGENVVMWQLYSTVGSAQMTGFLAEPPGTQHLILVIGGNPITFKHQDAGSAVGNRIIGKGYADYVGQLWQPFWIVYYATDWLVVAAT